jgi:glycine oxidase
VKQFDYIIVGCGLAGIAMCDILMERDRSFIVFENNSQKSSSVAAGMYNPVILKRFTPVWRAAEQLETSIPRYQAAERRLQIKIDHHFPLRRRFASVEEQNLWFTAADRPKLAPFLDLNIRQNSNKNIDAPFGFGTVKGAGRVDTAAYVQAYREELDRAGLLCHETFRYDHLLQSNHGIGYGHILAKHIVFSEGFGVRQNPFFRDLPLNGTKGEVLTVRIKGLQLETPIKSSVFIIPLGEDLYRVGATYSYKDKTNEPTKEGREELLTKLSSFIKGKIEVVDHRAGVRPTVKDRRPLVGQHPRYPNMYLLNGLGSRGVMIAPYVAAQLVNFIEGKGALEPEIDLNRFL